MYLFFIQKMEVNSLHMKDYFEDQMRQRIKILKK